MGDLVKRKIQTTLDTSNIRIGEFLGLLEILSPQVLDETLKVAKELDLPVGRATVLRGLITNEELSNIVQLHCMVRGKSLEIEEARQAFSIARREQWPVREALVALGCSIDDGGTAKIGQLLIESERLSEDDLDISLSLQKLCGLPLGRILTIDSRLPEKIVTEALTMQTDIRENRRTIREAVSRLRRLPLSNSEFAGRQQLLLNRQTLEASIDTTDLRTLLLAGNIIPESELDSAERFARAGSFDIEDVLRGYGWVDKEMLSAAAGLSGMVRDGYISGDEAISIIRALTQPNDSTLDMLSVLSPISGKPKALTLYQFLVTSGFLTPEGIRTIIRALMADADLFEEVTGISRRSFTDKQQVKRAIIKSILDSGHLEKSLSEVHRADKRVVAYGRDLLSLISYGVVSVDQAILSFARLRYDLGERVAKD